MWNLLADGLEHRPEFVGTLPGTQELAFGTAPDALHPAEFRRLPREPDLLRALELAFISVFRQRL
jgi:hypothetical protein